MFDCRKLNLQLRLRRARMNIKNLKYQIYPIPSSNLRFCFLKNLIDMINLSWLEYVSDNYYISSKFFSDYSHLIKLPSSDKCLIIRSIALLDSLKHNHRTISSDQILQLHHTVIMLLRPRANRHYIYKYYFQINLVKILSIILIMQIMQK